MSNDWQYLNVNGVPQAGSTTVGGGGGAVVSGWRSPVDARRSAANPARTPQAEYPDGYLGNVNSRRDDRLLNHVQSRLTQRSYQRGVHKGERVDPQDYYWNDIVNPQAGIEAESRGQRWTQVGTPQEQINHMGKNHLLSPEDFSSLAQSVGVKTPSQMDPVRSQRMARLLPRWK